MEKREIPVTSLRAVLRVEYEHHIHFSATLQPLVNDHPIYVNYADGSVGIGCIQDWAQTHDSKKLGTDFDPF